MSPSAEDLVALISKEAHDEMNDAVGAIKHCFDQLSEEQIWWRPDESMNSIGNLVLHVCGNMRQWIVSGVGGEPDARQRQSEFDERGPISKVELLQKLDDTLSDVKAVFARVTPHDLAQQHRIQGFDVTRLQAIFHSMAHLRGHTQEIVQLTRSQIGDQYKFIFVPSTLDEGSQTS